MTRGDTQTSIAQARHHKSDSLRRWRRRATANAQALDCEMLADLCVNDLELDEQWSFAGKKKASFEESNFRGEAWWHKAFARESRLLVEQFVSPRTPEAARRLVEDSFERLRLHCLPRVSSDGYDEYRKPLSEQVRPVKLHQLKLALKKQTRSGSPRKDRTIPDPKLVYGQVIKREEGETVRIEKKLMLGRVGEDLRWCSTWLLERQNATARSRNRYLTRKTLAFAKVVEYMEDQCILDKVFYNFCRKHRGLKWQTPAQRHGISDHLWSIAEVLRYRAADP
jgi:IS1 family transposase